VGTASLEVIESLETVEIRGSLRERVESKLVDGKLVLGVVGNKPLDEEHTDKVVRLSRFVNGDTRESRDENVIDSLVVENLVRRKDKAVVDRSHDLLYMTVVEGQNTVENGDLVVAERLLTLTMELKEALELSLLVAIL
jgi:hypothetical protein